MIHQDTRPLVLRMASAIATYIGLGHDEQPSIVHPSVQTPQPVSQAPSLRLIPTSPEDTKSVAHKWRRHPQLRSYTPPITPDVREARRLAVRGLYAAREGAWDVATDHFAQAATCMEMDLTAVPGFWELSRGQMQCAVEAYEQVERYRDAAALDSQISTVFRPNLVGHAPMAMSSGLAKHSATGSD